MSPYKLLRKLNPRYNVYPPEIVWALYRHHTQESCCISIASEPLRYNTRPRGSSDSLDVRLRASKLI